MHPIESTPYSAAIFGLTKRQPMLVSKSSASRPKGRLDFERTYGARVMCSTPPATYSSPSPRRRARDASTAALMPEAHSRLTVTPGTVGGRPASSSAMRATLRLSSPA